MLLRWVIEEGWKVIDVAESLGIGEGTLGNFEGFLAKAAAKVADVSCQVFYDWQAHRAAGSTAAERAEVELVCLMREIHAEFDGAYGVPRMTTSWLCGASPRTTSGLNG